MKDNNSTREIPSSAVAAAASSECPSPEMAHYTNKHKENEREISSTPPQNTFTPGDV